MEDEWNLKDHMIMKYHHMLEEGVYPEDAIDELRKRLLESCIRNELTKERILSLFGDIDTDYIKTFWEQRAKEHELNEGLVNLEDDVEMLALKIREEEKKLLPLIDVKGKTIIDLGSGYGQWAFKFIDRGAKFVTCVDYVDDMCEKGRAIAKRDNIKNIEFVSTPVQKFCSDTKYDIVFLSALCIHLNDTDFHRVLDNISVYTEEGSLVILRETTGVPDRISFDKEWSERLQTYYSGVYRTKEEFVELFRDIGFKLMFDDNMYPDGHPLNRFPKTRLRIYKFVRKK